MRAIAYVGWHAHASIPPPHTCTHTCMHTSMHTYIDAYACTHAGMLRGVGTRHFSHKNKNTYAHSPLGRRTPGQYGQGVDMHRCARKCIACTQAACVQTGATLDAGQQAKVEKRAAVVAALAAISNTIAGDAGAEARLANHAHAEDGVTHENCSVIAQAAGSGARAGGAGGAGGGEGRGGEGFGLDARIIQAMDTLGFTEPTSIQNRSLLAAAKGRDVIGIAETGAGS